MVSSMLFYQVNEIPNEIFEYSDSACFSGLPVLACGTFISYPQLKEVWCAVLAHPLIFIIFSPDLWGRFKMLKLTEEVKQKGDYKFINPNYGDLFRGSFWGERGVQLFPLCKTR